MHTLLDLHGNIPTFIETTDGAVHDVNILDEILPEPGALYVMDRGYIDFEPLYVFTLSAAFFVLRTMENILLQRRYSHPFDKSTGVRSDQTVILTTIESAKAYPETLRRVSFYDTHRRGRQRDFSALRRGRPLRFRDQEQEFHRLFTGRDQRTLAQHQLADDRRLVLCERAIDALSYAVLFPDERTRFGSIGGKPNPAQPELGRAAIARMPVQSEIIAAMDADEAGARLAERVREALGPAGGQDLNFVVHEPFGYKDWNDQLRAKPKSPPRNGEPSVA